MTENKEKNQINPYALIITALLGGGASSLGINIFSPVAPYTHSMAIEAQSHQEQTNRDIMKKIDKLHEDSIECQILLYHLSKETNTNGQESAFIY